MNKQSFNQKLLAALPLSERLAWAGLSLILATVFFGLYLFTGLAFFGSVLTGGGPGLAETLISGTLLLLCFLCILAAPIVIAAKWAWYAFACFIALVASGILYEVLLDSAT